MTLHHCLKPRRPASTIKNSWEPAVHTPAWVYRTVKTPDGWLTILNLLIASTRGINFIFLPRHHRRLVADLRIKNRKAYVYFCDPNVIMPLVMFHFNIWRITLMPILSSICPRYTSAVIVVTAGSVSSNARHVEITASIFLNHSMNIQQIAYKRAALSVLIFPSLTNCSLCTSINSPLSCCPRCQPQRGRTSTVSHPHRQ